MKPADELRKWGAATAAAKARRDSIAALLDECERVLKELNSWEDPYTDPSGLTAAYARARATLAKLRGQT